MFETIMMQRDLRLRNHFLEMSVNQFLIQWDLAFFSGANFLWIILLSNFEHENEVHLDSIFFLQIEIFQNFSAFS